MATVQARDTYYLGNGRGPGLVRAAAGYAFAPHSFFQPLFVVSATNDLSGDQVALCGIAPNGTCYGYFPSVSAIAIGAGGRANIGTRVQLEIAGGTFSFGRGSRYLSTTGVIRTTQHLGIVAEVRHQVWREANDAPHWIRPITFGFRVQ